MLRNLETFRTMFHEKLKIFLAKSDSVSTRNTSVIIFLLLKAISKIEVPQRKTQKHYKQRRKRWAEQQQTLINEARQNCPDQNAINLCNLKISDSEKSLVSKGPSYVPSPKDINFYKLKQLDLPHQKQRKKYTILEQSQLTNTHLKTSSKCLRLIYLALIIIKEFAITFQPRNEILYKNFVL